MSNLNQNINIKDIKIFLQSYKNFEKQNENNKILYYKWKYDNLFSGYKAIKNTIKIYNRKFSENYNIFKVLGIQTSEVKAHTPFLYNLLDPKGSHGQGDLFLMTFFNKFIDEDKRESLILSNTDDYYLRMEKRANDKGRMDIYITSKDLNKSFGIVIENKIYAGDQEDQLDRYDNFLRTQGFDTKILIYLTPWGNNPSEKSISKEKRETLKENKDLINLSYHYDIKSWLEETIPRVESEKMKTLINEYLEVINDL